LDRPVKRGPSPCVGNTTEPHEESPEEKEEEEELLLVHG
jgi:hypothetical protein